MATPRQSRERLRLSHVIWFLGSLIATAGIALPIAHPFREGGSGRLAGEYTVIGGPSASRVFELDLDPDMNPLRFNVSARLDAPSSSTMSYGFRGTLYLGKDTVVSQTWGFTIKSDESSKHSSVSLDAISVADAARYRYEVLGPSNLSGLRRLDVEIRRNVKTLSWGNTLAWAAGLIALGWFLTALGDKPPFIQRYEEEQRRNGEDA